MYDFSHKYSVRLADGENLLRIYREDGKYQYLEKDITLFLLEEQAGKIEEALSRARELKDLE